MGLVWFGNPPIMETYSQTFQMTACPYQSLLPQTTKALQKKTQKKREFCRQPKCYKKNNKYSILSPCCLVLLPSFSINLGEKYFVNISCQDIYFIIRFIFIRLILIRIISIRIIPPTSWLIFIREWSEEYKKHLLAITELVICCCHSL